MDRHSNFVREAELNVASAVGRWRRGAWSPGDISQGRLVLAAAHELGASHLVEYDCYARRVLALTVGNDGEVWEGVF
ncbi:MAG TPA: hypothetical protein VE687_04470 [Stellaceae bacterium]|nr:hypothetical protein [Stellaceae bacterium]